MIGAVDGASEFLINRIRLICRPKNNYYRNSSTYTSSLFVLNILSVGFRGFNCFDGVVGHRHRNSLEIVRTIPSGALCADSRLSCRRTRTVIHVNASLFVQFFELEGAVAVLGFEHDQAWFGNLLLRRRHCLVALLPLLQAKLPAKTILGFAEFSRLSGSSYEFPFYLTNLGFELRNLMSNFVSAERAPLGIRVLREGPQQLGGHGRSLDSRA